MSTFEYNDLYLKCQDTGIYHMFVFDIVDSRKIPTRERNIAQNKMIELMNRIYEKIKKELNIDFDFHLANGYYETNNYSEG